ncbi:MAG: Ig-like domain-containing protein, partial [Proteobacteria bacterium]|nr:Ig-like domain-containing protein [Pseudomonadota bacterium]
MRLYRSATCTGIEAAAGVASGGAFGIGITVTSNSTTPITATATDPAGNVSGCSAALTYVHDSLAPDAPVFTGTTPGSPSNINTPMISGTTEPAASVQLYSNATCTTALGTSVTANAGGMFTVAITVANDSATAIYAIATDAANNKSPCSAPFTFVEDSTAPGTPTLSQLPPSISSTTPTLTGTTEGNASVDLFTNGTCSGAAAATSTATAGGAFAIMVTVTANTTTTFTAKATDAAGNASACSAIATYTHDNMTPSAPSGLATTPVGPASSNTPSVSGMAEAGATVRLFTNPTCSTAVAGTTTAIGGDTFAVAISVANGSTTTFYATATDPAGNGSACSASFITYTQDSAPPSAPTGLATVPVGPSSSNTPSVTGAAEANSTVQIFTNATCTGAPAFSGTASGAGTFSIAATVVANTTTTFHANAVDAANNTSACSTSNVSYVEDSTATSTPTILATSPGSPANNNGPAVSGTAEAGSTVKLYTMVGCAGAVANSGIATGTGAFSIVAAVSDNSTTSFYATATDPAGNISGCSTARVYVEDSLAPSTPSALDTSPTSPVNNTNPSITGTADAGTTVAIYTSATCSGASIGTGTATVGNTFSIPVSVAANTTSTFYARATDAANNQSSCSSSVSYIEDSTKPGLPTLTSTSPLSPSGSATPTVSGTAEANSTVKIYAGSCTTLLATGTATAGGTFAIVTPVTANATTTLRATATDAASNVSAGSASSLTYTNDATAPSSPTALAVTPAVTANNNAPVVSGLAEAGSLVTLYTNAACTTLAGSSGTAAGDGTYAISLAVTNNSTTMYYATAQDAAGNVSACSTSTVTFVEDSLVPATPTGLTTTPPSPSNVNTPSITGTAEAGSTVKIYSNPACTTQVATGTAAAFASPGIAVTVGNDSSTSFYATATDAASNVSACSAAVAYAEDSTAPNAPVITSTNPTSPANDTTPILGGTTEANSTVKLYTNAACSGAPVGSTASTAGGTFSIAASAVTANTTTTYYATATDAATNVSACTAAAFTYVEDSSPPVPPSGLATSPASPANNNSPLITGSAEANSTVTIFTNATCTGAPAFSTTASAVGTFSKAVAVADNTTTTFYVQATDAAANKSTCNAAGSFITYVEDSTATAVPILVSTTPTSPSNASTTPTVTGTTGAGFAIRIYSNAACTTLLAGPFAADGAGNFTSPAITVTGNTTTTFYATATNTTTSACSAGLVYVHDSMA